MPYADPNVNNLSETVGDDEDWDRDIGKFAKYVGVKHGC